MPTGLSPFEAPFRRAAERVKEQFWFTEDWLCKCGLWPDDAEPACMLLKTLKKHWTGDDPKVLSNQSGIFFSMWVDAKDVARLRFNIHALKLRELKGYALESRKFAAAFRTAFVPQSATWPQFRDDFGPQTLIEGVVPTCPEVCEELLVSLAAQFVTASIVIERLLAEAKKPAS